LRRIFKNTYLRVLLKKQLFFLQKRTTLNQTEKSLTMTKIFLGLIISLTILSSCITSKKQFGEILIENTADTTLTKQEISKIRSLNPDIFDAGTFTDKEQLEIKYRLFKPQQSNKKYPLVVVYHGSGRPIGTDNAIPLGNTAEAVCKS
jgi:predicted peptidase